MDQKFIITGGGTGGHIFPAIAIANKIRQKNGSAQILFVGAIGRMEMTQVPLAGYEIVGLPVMGLYRKKIWKNITVLIHLVKSWVKAYSVVKNYQPDVVIGVGGYASAPTLLAAFLCGRKILLQEQNSYAGLTNKFLAQFAHKICVSYPDMERYFPKDKLVLTGNPVRSSLFKSLDASLAQGYDYFHLDPDRPTLLLIGGSLGAATLNRAMQTGAPLLIEKGFQIIWQTGKSYYHQLSPKLAHQEHLYLTEFLSEMGLAYRVADIIISRAGASSISELCLIGKPTILVPSPNVAEDHQTKNAMALVNHQAAILISDHQAESTLAEKIVSLYQDPNKMQQLSCQIKTLAQESSDDRIVDQIFQLI